MSIKRTIFLVTFFLFLFGFLFLFKSTTPVYAYWKYVCDTCYDYQCTRQLPYSQCLQPPYPCDPCGEIDNCAQGKCRITPYDCNCRWVWVPDPAPPTPTPTPPIGEICQGLGGDTDGDGVCDYTDPCPEDPTNSCASSGICNDNVDNDGDGWVDADDPDCDAGTEGGGSCTTPADCPAGYDCIGGVCETLCQQAGSGTQCAPDLPNNGCPEGEVCCWGVQQCWITCCSGGGPTPDTTNPQCGVEIDPQTPGWNEVNNSGFEPDCSYWDCSWINVGVTCKGSWRRSGRCALRGTGYWKVTQEIPVEQGAIYKLSLYGRAQKDTSTGSWGEASVKIDDGAGGLHGILIAYGKYGDTGWQHFETTYFAHDSTLTLTLIGDSSGDGWYAFAGFDDITLQKITGAESVESLDVPIRVGVWDDRSMAAIKIQNSDGSWPDYWTSFSWRDAASNIFVTLPEFGGLGVAVEDNRGNIGICADGTPPDIEQTGTITGKVYESPDGTCSGTTIPSGDCAGWVVTCDNLEDSDSGVEAIKLDASTYQCQIGGSTDLPYGTSYGINISASGDCYSVSGCNAAFVYLDSAAETASDLYISPIFGAWFQTQGGDVHAQTTITDPIPDTVPADERYCSLLGDGGYPGVVSYGTSYNFDEGSASPDPFGWLANSSYQGDPYGYDYFDGLIDQDDDGDPVLSAGKSTILPGIYKISGNQEITSDWDIGSTESYVFLIDGGKLTINNNIVVPEGGFLAFIVDGDIEIEEGVTTLEGIYIADGEIETSGQNEDNDQLSAKGIFVSWEKVLLNRTFENESLNNTLPVETFVFRPDIWINAPKELLKSSYTWQELAP